MQNRDTQALLPLTVKQISEAFLSSDDKSNFLIDGVEVNNVEFLQFDFSGPCLLQFWFLSLESV